MSELVTICIVFSHKEERWSHTFRVTKGSTVAELKRSMVDPSSPEDDHISFDLLQQRLRLSNLDLIDSDETLEFRYIGPEEGRRKLERDQESRKREEEASRRSREEEQRRMEVEKARREEAARQQEEAERQRLERLAEAERATPEESSKPGTPEESSKPGTEASPPAATQPAEPPKQVTPAAVPKKDAWPAQASKTWVWTSAGVAGVASHASMFGNPRPDDEFTERHLILVKQLFGGFFDYPKLMSDNCIKLGKPRQQAAQPTKAAAAATATMQRFVVTHRESGDRVEVELASGQAVLDLRKAICSHVGRGPPSKLTLMQPSGKLLGDMTQLNGLSDAERAGLLASGLSLGAAVPVAVTIFHAAKGSTAPPLTVNVPDNGTFLDVKQALCELADGKVTEVRLMCKKPGSAALVGCKDSDRILGLREIGAIGRLMDRLRMGP